MRERRLEQGGIKRRIAQPSAEPVERPAGLPGPPRPGLPKAGLHQGIVALVSNSSSSEALYISGTTSSYCTSMTNPWPLLRIVTSLTFGESM